MCGFLFSTNSNLADEVVSKATHLLNRRGPTSVNTYRENDFLYHHALLNITGPPTEQPVKTADNRYAVLLNGEYYAHNLYGEMHEYGDGNEDSNDTVALTKLFEEYTDKFGSDELVIQRFFQGLRGEYAICIHDRKEDRVIVASDTFGTKPLAIATDNQENLYVSSYPSALLDLGCPQTRIARWRPNTIGFFYRHPVNPGWVFQSANVMQFDIRQHKTSFDDWLKAFELSITRRTRNSNIKYFLGLSSGYDSGSIAAECIRQGVDFKAYSIYAAEDPKVIDARQDLCPAGESFKPTKDHYRKHQEFMAKYCEPYQSAPRPGTRPNGYSVHRDKGAVGTSMICELAKRDNRVVYLSGQGSDETMSDYGYNGRPASGFGHTTIAGKFPEDLSTVFPWENFFTGTQMEFIAKDENVGGSYGIETRYPFLDRDLVQEFLWLTHDLKNSNYKAPLYHYLKNVVNFPTAFGLSNKVGFRANTNFAS